MIAARILMSILVLGFCSLVEAADKTAASIDQPTTVATQPHQVDTQPAGEITQRGDPTHLDVQLDLAGPLEVRQIDKQQPSGIDWATVFSSLLAAGVGAGGALLVGWWSQRGIRDSLAQNANAAELKELQAKLDSFYGPYRQLSEVNKLLADEFKSRQPDKAFRTLTLLLKEEWQKLITKPDRAIVSEIVANDIALNKLIMEHSGLVDSKLVPYLARAGAHFRLMELAYKGMLEDVPERFQRYVYPRQLDEALNLEIDRLTNRCEQLRRHSAQQAGAMASLEIPDSLRLPDWPSTLP